MSHLPRQHRRWQLRVYLELVEPSILSHEACLMLLWNRLGGTAMWVPCDALSSRQWMPCLLVSHCGRVGRDRVAWGAAGEHWGSEQVPGWRAAEQVLQEYGHGHGHDTTVA